jgi:hypothetical protein
MVGRGVGGGDGAAGGEGWGGECGHTHHTGPKIQMGISKTEVLGDYQPKSICLRPRPLGIPVSNCKKIAWTL